MTVCGQKKSGPTAKAPQSLARERRDAGNNPFSPFGFWIPIVVSVFALIISILSYWENKRRAEIDYRPIVGMSFYYNDSGAGYSSGNGGSGVAEIAYLEVLFDGIPMKTWEDLADKIGMGRGEYSFNNFKGIMRPDTSVKPLWADYGKASNALKKNQSRIELRYCYCSLYGGCWINSNMGNTQQPVDECPTNITQIQSPPMSVKIPVP